MDKARAFPFRHPRRTDAPLRVGFVPLAHAAPLLIAQELGLFARHGLNVRLTREVGWATVREKILSGDLDAAQALAPMPLAMSLGLNSARVNCLTGLVLTVHGDAIVFSRKLWSATGGDLAILSAHIRRQSAPVTFAVVYPHSTQLYVLRDWLAQAGLVPDRDYRLVVVPPPQMSNHLKAGHIDGYCVGEPWASVAVRSGVGVIAALSADLAPGHPEKVLLVRQDFALQRHEEHLALIRALYESCTWCGDRQNRDEVVNILARRNALGLPTEALRPSVTGDLDLGAGRRRTGCDAMIFHGDDVNDPNERRVEWIARHVDPTVSPETLGRVYRSDLFHEAIASKSMVCGPYVQEDILTDAS